MKPTAAFSGLSVAIGVPITPLSPLNAASAGSGDLGEDVVGDVDVGVDVLDVVAVF